MNLSIDYLQFLNGTAITMVLTFFALAIGLLLAISMSAGHFLGNLIVKKGIDLFIFFICGTPLLIQLFLIYYGLGQFTFIRHSYLWVLLREPFFCAILALSLNTAAYTTTLFKGTIKEVPANEIAAGYALGMSKYLAFKRIIFPRAFRMALPAYSNEIIMILKSTSLASTITLLDLMGMTQKLIAETYDVVTLYVIAGGIYLLLNSIMILIFRVITKPALHKEPDLVIPKIKNVAMD